MFPENWISDLLICYNWARYSYTVCPCHQATSKCTVMLWVGTVGLADNNGILLQSRQADCLLAIICSIHSVCTRCRTTFYLVTLPI